jgi:hypothetical protein
MPEGSAQRRRYPRYITDLEVTVYTASGAIQTRIKQLSRGGCLIFPPLPAEASSSLKISFRVSQDLPFVNCKGEVAYSIMDKGTGVAFTEISIFNQELITQQFEKQTPAE